AVPERCVDISFGSACCHPRRVVSFGGGRGGRKAGGHVHAVRQGSPGERRRCSAGNGSSGDRRSSSFWRPLRVGVRLPPKAKRCRVPVYVDLPRHAQVRMDFTPSSHGKP
ncbi:unnamed protein product, partial [Laminaria digitata]